LTLIVIVFMVIYGPTVRDLISRTTKAFEQAQVCQNEMQTVWMAVEEFHREKGKYPDKLESLVPRYLADESKLRCSQHPQGARFIYHKPQKDAPSTTIVLEYSVPVSLPNMSAIPLRLMKNGQFEEINIRFNDRERSAFPSSTR